MKSQRDKIRERTRKMAKDIQNGKFGFGCNYCTQKRYYRPSQYNMDTSKSTKPLDK